MALHKNTNVRTSFLVAAIMMMGGQLACADADWYQDVIRSSPWIVTENHEGTGAFIDADRLLVLTNAHAVGDAQEAIIFFPTIRDRSPVTESTHYLKQRRTLGIPGRVIAIDSVRDLAVIRLRDKVPQQARVTELADQSIAPGKTVYTIDNRRKFLWRFMKGSTQSNYAKRFRTGDREYRLNVAEFIWLPIGMSESGPIYSEDRKLVAFRRANPHGRHVPFNLDISEIKSFLETIKDSR